MSTSNKETSVEKFWHVWERLRPHWSPYLKQAMPAVGSKFDSEDRDEFLALLEHEFEIDRRLPGLEDFALEGQRCIHPGDPALSLLYHAFASPHVTPAGIPDDAYPTMADLEVVENYIYSRRKLRLEEIEDWPNPLAIAVFAYEYAPASDTVHKRHADFCYSRTGIARVGTHKPNYVPQARGYFPASGTQAKPNPGQVHVVPARYGAFLAEELSGDKATFGPLHPHEKDAGLKFWVPFHKLFSGQDCILGLDLDLRLDCEHRNEKIKKIHQALHAKGFDTGWSPSQLEGKPFVLSKDLAHFCGRCSHVIPEPHDPLVEPATTEDGKLVGFPVPHRSKTFDAALSFDETFGAQQSPEFVHAKHAILTDGEGKQTLDYLPDAIPTEIDAYIQKGGYTAANFLDWTADGWIRAECEALAKIVPKHLAAYSILAQPDFYPLVKQQDLAEWWKTKAPKELKHLIWPDLGIEPNPLSWERVPVNLTLRGAGFESNDLTMTAIVGTDFRRRGKKATSAHKAPMRESTLSGRSTNVFAPGWDTAKDFGRDRHSQPHGALHLAHYGLGSPFPEDTLICAAMGAFWPAAVVDVTRFFAPNYPSSTPIVDDMTGWDGPDPQKLPTFPTANVAEFRNKDYADYVRALWRSGDKFQYEKFAFADLDDYLLRTMVAAEVYCYLGNLPGGVGVENPKTSMRNPEVRMKYPFLSFRVAYPEEVAGLNKAGWNIRENPVYQVVVAEYIGQVKVNPPDPRRIQVNLKNCKKLFAGLKKQGPGDPNIHADWVVGELDGV